ncbi:MAG: glycogen/starch synthase [Candidatus Competibacteraceae bacterium]|nr:glycogen/starch synthase [Candidatus Competibacteraceae bacterium]
MEKRKVLFISQEMQPYTVNETLMGKISRQLPQGIMEQGYEIRTFMPRFGCINERRHQLHEVIRLSGMNIIINDTDQPLIIKVASIPSARMQVYFIDNDEYFKRKSILTDDAGSFFNDNDERAIFFVRGVFETVKKLGWSPDIIHCHGWMSGLASVYLKTAYKDDPVFSNARIVVSLYNSDQFDQTLSNDFATKVICGEMSAADYSIDKPTYPNLIKSYLGYADAIVKGGEPIHKDLDKHIKNANIKTVDYNPEEDYVGPMLTLYEELIDESVVAE